LITFVTIVEIGIGETEGTKHDLHQAILRDEAVARLHELGQVFINPTKNKFKLLSFHLYSVFKIVLFNL